jgi:hypothetical protein
MAKMTTSGCSQQAGPHKLSGGGHNGRCKARPDGQKNVEKDLEQR